jgi:MFS family permease
MTSSGSALFALLERCLDADVFESVVAPTIADLQFEVQRTASPWRRRVARLRGYLAISRVLLWHGLIWRSPMRTLLTVVVLGLMGAALLVEMFSVTTSGPAQISPFFLMTVLAPLVIRFVAGVNTRRRMFAACMAAGSVMSVVFLAWFAIVKNPAHAPWYAYVPGLVFLLGCVAVASAMIASVTATPEAPDQRNVRGRMLDVIASTATFAIFYILIGFLRHHPAARLGALATVSWGVFLAFFFVLVSVVIYLPILVSSRRVLPQRTRVPLAVFGASLFPIPMLAFPLLQGRLEEIAQLLLREPLAFALTAIPYVLAGAMLGWLIAAPPHEVQHSV